ncbi:MAG: hypothetical protein PVG39_15520 [Desulfobacteraceae bacterium]
MNMEKNSNSNNPSDLVGRFRASLFRNEPFTIIPRATRISAPFIKTKKPATKRKYTSISRTSGLGSECIFTL